VTPAAPASAATMAVAAAAPLGLTPAARQQMAADFRAQFADLRQRFGLPGQETTHA